jgi:hypothetical protein
MGARRTIMKRFLEALAIAAALSFAAPASAQAETAYGAELHRNVARLNLGVGFYNSGWYNCYYYYGYYNCTSGSYSSFVPFVAGAQVDLNTGGANNLSLGVQANMGTVSSTAYAGVVSYTVKKQVVLWEPTVDYVGKYGSPMQATVSRFRGGVGVLFGPDGGLGAVVRLGGGVSLLNNQRVGVGLDFVFEGGGYNGYWIGGLQIVASPEFHF